MIAYPDREHGYDSVDRVAMVVQPETQDADNNACARQPDHQCSHFLAPQCQGHQADQCHRGGMNDGYPGKRMMLQDMVVIVAKVKKQCRVSRS